MPGETASRLGHLDILKSELVSRLVNEFESEDVNVSNDSINLWESFNFEAEPLNIVFGIDGSIQTITSTSRPYKTISFVKSSLLRLDTYALSKVDKDAPNPFRLRDILSESALYHATIFPLRHVTISGLTIYHTIRSIIFQSIKDNSLNNELMETLKWIAFEKWDKQEKQLPYFECPHCREMVATLPYDTEIGKCPQCKKEIYLTDMLGFHQDIGPESANNAVANTYMVITEMLLLFTGVRYFWENKRELLNDCLFVKDGPLNIRAQYSKLVNPIRRFLAYARDQRINVHILGQEKSGRFYDHLELIGNESPNNSVFIPGDSYIKRKIQQRQETGAFYGKDTNYGAKVFLNYSYHQKMVLNIPTGEFNENPTYQDLIGIDRIIATLPNILSNKYEGALLPIELAHGIASLSTYPSAKILKVFAETENILD